MSRLLCFLVVCAYAVCGKDDIKIYSDIDFGIHNQVPRRPIVNSQPLPVFTSSYLGSRWRPALPWSAEDYDERQSRLDAISRTIAEILQPVDAMKRTVTKLHRYHDYPEMKTPDKMDEIFENIRENYRKGLHKEFEMPKVNDEIDEGDDEMEEEKDAVDEPSVFGYPPSDPRYYDQTPQLEITNNSKNNPEDYGVEFAGTYVKANSEVDSDDFPKESQKANDYRGIKVVAVSSGLGEENVAGVYIVAVVAGISAAATVGLIAFAIGWHK